MHDFVKGLSSLPSWSQPEVRPLGDCVLAVQDVTFSYVQGEPVLIGLDLEMRQGEFVAIIGANGSGKSTLVKNLVGLLQPDEGRIFINEHDTRRMNLSETGTVAWFSALLDDFGEWQGEPVGWEDARWTGVLEKRDGRWVIVQMHFSFAEEQMQGAEESAEGQD